MYRLFRAPLLTILLLLACASGVSAAPGALDTSFGIGGFATAPINTTYPGSVAYDIALSPTGQIVAAASRNDGGVYRVMVQRFNADGSTDTSFGDGGLATAEIPTGFAINVVAGVGVQPDGSVVVGARVYPTPATTPGVFAVIRFTPSGQLDTGFDGDSAGNGILMLTVGPPGPPNPSEVLRDLIVEPSGKIVMAGDSEYSGHANLSVGRLNPDGTWDTSFSGDGKFSQVFTTTDLDFWSIADVPGDGGYAIGGRLLPGSGPTITQPTVVRIKEDGTLDTSFTGGVGNLSPTPGVVTYLWSTDNTRLGEIKAVVADPAGGFIAGGYQNAPLPNPGYYGLARYTATGALDPSFGSGGLKIDRIGGGGSAIYDLAVQPNGKILAGMSGVDSNTGFVGRFNSDGSPDTSFGNDGVVDPAAYAADRIALQPDGKLVVSVRRTGQTETTLMRLLTADDPISTLPVLTPTVKISTPAKKSLKTSKLKAISGTAGPAGSIAKVEIALQRKDSKLLKKHKKCAWLSSSKAKFKNSSAKKGKCRSPRYLKVAGSTSWKYKLKKTLPVGSYALTARVTLTSGAIATKTYSFKLTKK
ncbi:MAG: hypothetical protein QM648_10125 [Solirubrobacterales bacterium]